MKFSKTYVLLLSCTGISFLFLYCILSYNNRLSYEEYFLVSMRKDMGTIQAMIDLYMNLLGRWATYTLSIYLLRFFENEYFLFVFCIGTAASLMLSIFLLANRVMNDFFNWQVKKNILALYAILFTCCFFFSSYSTGETWFWYIAAWIYLWSIIAGNFLFYVLLSGKLKWLHILPMVLLSAYIGGSSESYSLIYIFALTSILFLKQKDVKNLFTPLISRISYPSLFLALCLLTAFSLVTLLAPGTWARKSILTHAPFLQHCIMVLKAYGKINLLQTPKLIPFLILFGIPWMELGRTVSLEKKIKMENLPRLFFKSILLNAVLIFILILPASWILYDLPPARALSQVSLVLTLYAALFFFYLGCGNVMTDRLKRSLVSVSSIASIGVLIYYCFTQWQITNTFSSAYDQRILQIKQEVKNERHSVLKFEALPPPGMLYSDELYTDSMSNAEFENSYNLEFHVAKK